MHSLLLSAAALLRSFWLLLPAVLVACDKPQLLPLLFVPVAAVLPLDPALFSLASLSLLPLDLLPISSIPADLFPAAMAAW